MGARYGLALSYAMALPRRQSKVSRGTLTALSQKYNLHQSFIVARFADEPEVGDSIDLHTKDICIKVLLPDPRSRLNALAVPQGRHCATGRSLSSYGAGHLKCVE